METTSYQTYSAALLKRPLKLEDAEDVLDAVMADASLAHDQRESLVWYFHRRAFQNIDDARHTFKAWLKEYRESVQGGTSTSHTTT